jgi:NAD(P)H-flavin reductase
MSTARADSGGQDDAGVPRLARVLSRRRELDDVFTLELAVADGTSCAFAPGQFNMLTAFGVGEAAISLSGDPGRTDRLVHTIRAVGAVSRALAALRPGQPLGLRGPFGQPWPLEAARGGDVVVVAGGLGLAPLRPLLYQLFATREHYGDVHLFYGARSPASLLFSRELGTWPGRYAVDVQCTVDHAPGGWDGQVGVVTTLLGRGGLRAPQTTAFVCGPELMMRFAVNALRTGGVAESSIYVSLERNMKCAVAWCGRCQLGPVLLCRDGPVFRYDRVGRELATREL